MPARNVCRLPDAIDFETGAAMMLKGLTAQYLLKKTLPVEGLQAGDFVLIHAAAGGVGLIACQWAKALGLHGDRHRRLARPRPARLEHGCGARDRLQRPTNFVARVTRDHRRQGCQGGLRLALARTPSMKRSLDCLRPFGLIASFGNASGPVPPFAPGILGTKGSLYVTRSTLITLHRQAREATQAMADELFEVVGSGQVNIAGRPDVTRWSDVAQAHRDLEARKTTGSTVLLP
jgi:NADPH2:quinone reductase